MKKFAKIINEETKACEVGTGTNTEFYNSISMSEMEVEQAWNGAWYLKGYAPEKPIEEKEAEVRAVRNQYLEQTDKVMLVDYPITSTQKTKYKQYRVYLRDYPDSSEDWFKHEPMSFDEWSTSQTTS